MPFILGRTEIRSQHFLEHTIHLLSLSIILRMEGSRHALRNANLSTNLLEECRCKSWVTVRDDGPQPPTTRKDLLHKELGKFLGTNRSLSSSQKHQFNQPSTNTTIAACPPPVSCRCVVRSTETLSHLPCGTCKGCHQPGGFLISSLVPLAHISDRHILIKQYCSTSACTPGHQYY